MGFKVTINLNAASGVNLQEPSQSSTHDALALEKLKDFRAFQYLEFWIRDSELCV
jgi:hypothetical protein